MNEQNILNPGTPRNEAPRSAGILVGGQSSRMGRNKAAMLWREQSFLDRITSTLLVVFPEVLFVGGLPDDVRVPAGVSLVGDLHPGRGPLGGIHSALLHTGGEAVFITACDTPRITSNSIRTFLEHWDGASILVARDGDQIHPLFGVYTKSALPAIEIALRNGDLRLLPLLRQLCARYVEVRDFNDGKNPDLLTNVNTPEDYRRLLLDPGHDDIGNRANPDGKDPGGGTDGGE